VKQENADKIGEKLFMSVLIPSLGMVFLATLLVILEIYSITLMAVCMTTVLIPLYILVFRKKRLLSPSKLIQLLRAYRFSKISIIVLLAAIFLYFGFPTTYLAGGRDPGLYLINAVRVSQTGSYQVAHDDYLSENYDQIKDFVSLEYPGIYSDYYRGSSADPGDRTAQFLPMFSATLAIGYDLFGMQGLLLTNSYISVLALFAIYYFVRSFSGRTTALIAMILMLVNPAQLWAARITQTEILAQLLVILALWSFSSFYRKRTFLAAVLSGALLGFGCINRIDMLVLGLGIYAIAAFCVIIQPGQIGYALMAAGSYTISAGLSVIYTFYFCNPYFMDLFKANSLSGILLLNAAFASLVFPALIVKALFLRKKKEREDLLSHDLFRKLIQISTILLFLAFLFAYFIRPVISGAEFGTQKYFVENAMAEFCFYTSFIAVPMAIFGMYRLLTSKKKGVEGLFLFLLTGLASLIGYIYRPSIVFDHIWASRRWVPVAIPFIIILCAYSIPELARGMSLLLSRIRRAKAVKSDTGSNCPATREHPERSYSREQLAFLIAVTMILAGFGIYQTRAFLFVRIFDSLEADYQSLAEALDDEKVYFTKNDQIASVLRYVYGENVYMIKDKETAILELIRNGAEFYFIGDPLLENRFDLDVESRLLSEHQIDGQYLERAYNDYPDTTYQWSMPANIYALVYTGSNQRDLEFESLILADGTLDELGISSGKSPGFVFYGPYAMIRKGTYTITVRADLISSVGDEIMKLDVAGNQGQTVFGEKTIRRSDFSDAGIAEVSFSVVIPETCFDFEFRCLSVDGASFRVTQINFKREK
jgi:hypothetical protein